MRLYSTFIVLSCLGLIALVGRAEGEGLTEENSDNSTNKETKALAPTEQVSEPPLSLEIPAGLNDTETQTPSVAASKAGETDLYTLGANLFEAFAPEEIKRDYEFPSRSQWTDFMPRLQRALDGDSLEELAKLEDQAHQALELLQSIPGTEAPCLWLHDRLEMIEAARSLALYSPQPTPPYSRSYAHKRSKPSASNAASRLNNNAFKPEVLCPEIPAYDYWYTRIKDRPIPAGARELMPLLRSCFTEEDSPSALAWLAEVESTFNPRAKSPVGATGLYQLMPATARGLGLSTSWPDERTNPAKSARAAARLLNSLHRKFGDWPLALAAYNAGEGRVRRLLTKHKATTFAGIAAALPVETRLYVPKVLATVTTRTGLTPSQL